MWGGVWGGISMKFWFAFSWILVLRKLSIISCACWASVSCSWESTQFLSPFFNWVFCFYDVQMYDLFVCIGCAVLSHFSCVKLFVIPWTVACQVPLPRRFSRQEYWSGLPCPSPGMYCILSFYWLYNFQIYSPVQLADFSSVIVFFVVQKFC